MGKQMYARIKSLLYISMIILVVTTIIAETISAQSDNTNSIHGANGAQGVIGAGGHGASNNGGFGGNGGTNNYGSGNGNLVDGSSSTAEDGTPGSNGGSIGI